MLIKFQHLQAAEIKYIREAQQAKSEDIVPIKEELQFAEGLIEYYQTIFPDSKVKFDIKGEVPPFSPALITESIIGNAFKHGITNISGEIKIIFDFTSQLFLYLL